MNLFGKWTQTYWILQVTTPQVYFTIAMTKVGEEYFIIVIEKNIFHPWQVVTKRQRMSQNNGYC